MRNDFKEGTKVMVPSGLRKIMRDSLNKEYEGPEFYGGPCHNMIKVLKEHDWTLTVKKATNDYIFHAVEDNCVWDWDYRFFVVYKDEEEEYLNRLKDILMEFISEDYCEESDSICEECKYNGFCQDALSLNYHIKRILSEEGK